MEVKLNFKASILVIVILVVGLGVRLASFSASSDPVLEKAVRDVLWSTYSGTHLSAEINEIRKAQDYDSVDSLINKASPQAILIEKISRSQPLMSSSSNQKVIVRVSYRFPDDTSSRIEYMEFKHGGLIDAWSYHYEVSVISYYMNFF